MTTTMQLIAKQTVGAGGASSVTFSNIPQTYTDLKVVVSARSNRASVTDDVVLGLNGVTTNQSIRALFGNGATASSATDTTIYGSIDGASATTSTFGNTEFYIPNYTSANNKSVSVDAVNENNATTAYSYLTAGLWSSSAAITSIVLTSFNSATFVEFSTFYLYGISNSTTTQATTVPYASGGDVITTDGTYWYHAFKYSGSFTPLKNLTADVLVVAGGAGGSGGYEGGAGGAGGIQYKSASALTASTAYTCSIGSGGAGTAGGTNGTNGVNSFISGTAFSTITANGGGGGGAYIGSGNSANGSAGGSGGGTGRAATGGASNQSSSGGATSYGNAGGNGAGAGGFTTSGGGGAGAVGSVGNNGTDAGGAGGVGLSTWSSWGLATTTGQNVSGTVYYAGGGGGAGGTTVGAGGYGGGGAGGISVAGGNGLANTGGGGGGVRNVANGGNGGSGIIIVRYAV